MKKLSVIFMIAVALMLLCTACPSGTTKTNQSVEISNDTLTVVNDTLKMELKLDVDSVKLATEE